MVIPKDQEQLEQHNQLQVHGSRSRNPHNFLVSFNDCITDYFRSETLDSNNLLKCTKCLNYNRTRIQFKIKTLPRILLMHMKRFDDNGRKLNFDIDCPLNFSFKLEHLNEDLARKERDGYVKKEDELGVLGSANMNLRRVKKRKHSYELYGMIVHTGNFSAKGHYYAVVKHKTLPNTWIKFDDETVTLIKD
jgi:ubiquitin C-terminal hydrolase